MKTLSNILLTKIVKNIMERMKVRIQASVSVAMILQFDSFFEVNSSVLLMKFVIYIIPLV